MRRILGALALLPVLAAAPARAEFKIDAPVVEPGEIVLEHAGSLALERPRGRSFTASLGYGVLPFLFLEVEGLLERSEADGGATEYQGTTVAGTFQLWKPNGDDSLVLGLKAELTRAAPGNAADSIKLGPLLQAELGPIVATFNVFGEREIGSGSRRSIETSYGVQLLRAVTDEIGIALEVFGEERRHRIGPTLTGEVPLGPGKLAYELGVLFGLSNATPDRTLKWLLNYALPF